MWSNEENLYNPYLKSDLPLVLNKEILHGNNSLFLVSDVDLFFQPVEEPMLGITYFLIGLVITIVGEIIQLKLFKRIKDENSLLKEITQIYCVSSIVMYPILLFITSGPDFVHPLNELIGKWFCPTIWGMQFFFFNLFTFHSFFAAVMRYFFIIHQEKVEKFGKWRMKRIFIALYVFLPTLMVVLSTIERPELDPFLYINRCYGRDHRLFLKDMKSLDVLNPYFCDSDTIGDLSWIQNIRGIAKKLICISKLGLSVIMGFNVTEGFIYWAIFKHIKR